jgi:chromosome segregation ATPase
MQLEKVTSHSGEAGLAGWISSNDVTLFTVVVVIAVAIFLQSNLTKRSRKNQELQAVNLTLNDENRESQEEIGRISTELQDVNGRLIEARSQLQAAKGNLEQTSLDLDEKIQNLKAVSLQLERTKTELEATRQQQRTLEKQLGSTQDAVKNLNEKLAALEIERGSLTTVRDQLTEEKGDLTKQKVKLDQDLAELAAQLASKLQQLDDLQRERDLLNEKAEALAERVKRLEAQLGDSQRSLTEAQTSSQSEMEELKRLSAQSLERHKQVQTSSAENMQAVMTRAEQADAQAKEAGARADDYLDRLRRAAAMFKDMDENKKLLQLEIQALKTQLANALDDLKASEQQLVQQRTREKTINRELVGLRGELRRVAILFDSSGSMSQSGRWEEVQRIASTWLDYLEVDECVLIVFASDAKAFPADGSMLRVSGPNGDVNRAKLMAQLRSVQPEGWTNTLAAMKKAYAYDGIDTIILFSDGAPTYANSGTFHPESAQQIYALCRQHKNVPVNAIGLGNYFDQELSTFLRTVASLTGGTFVGR